MYPEEIVKPMKLELTESGFNDLKTKEEVESAISKNGTTLLVDVKTNYRPSGRTDIQKKLGVVYLVRKKYGEFHFVKHREIKNA